MQYTTMLITHYNHFYGKNATKTGSNPITKKFFTLKKKKCFILFFFISCIVWSVCIVACTMSGLRGNACDCVGNEHWNSNWTIPLFLVLTTYKVKEQEQRTWQMKNKTLLNNFFAFGNNIKLQCRVCGMDWVFHKIALC